MRCECVINFRFVLFVFFIAVIASYVRLVYSRAAEAMPLDSASNRDAASDRDASMRQLEKISAMAKALTAERLLLGTRAADKIVRRFTGSSIVNRETQPSAVFEGYLSVLQSG